MDIRAQRYSAGIMSESAWFLEFKKLIQLRKEGVDDTELKRLCLEENLFGMGTANRVKRTSGYLIRRLGFLDEALVDIFCSSDLATQKIINLIAILRGDLLFFEFVNEVYREKAMLGFQEIGPMELNSFFRAKMVASDALADWKDTTIRKVGSAYLNFLADANLLDKRAGKYVITVPILDITLEDYLKRDGDIAILKAITGVA